MQERLTELEMRVAFQDKTIDELNEAVTRQQVQIDKLVQEIDTLKSRLKTLTPSNIASSEEETPPPHF